MFKFPHKYRIALVAPAGVISPETAASGRAILEKYGHEVKIMPHLFTGGTLLHLSADDADRASDINAAIDDEEIEIIWAVRGGAGSLRILDRINWKKLKDSGKYFAGFSDITAIHWAMAANNSCRYLAAPMMKFLAENREPLTGETLFAALNGSPVSLQLPALRPGSVNGTALAGNLTVAAALCGSRYLPDTTGRVLVLEDIGEAPYRIDRCLTQLRINGVFDHCAGIIFGRFTDCGNEPELMAVLKDFTGKVSCPVFCGLCHGHELPFYSLCGTQEISVTAAG